MSESRKSASSSTAGVAARVVAGLVRPKELDDYGIDAARTVMCLRLLALCHAAHRDPIEEFNRRLGSVAAAKAMLGFLDRCGTIWPETIHAYRPCCSALGPDESVIAGMVQAAADGNYGVFDSVLSGFIPAEQSGGLFAEALALVDAL